MNKLAIFVLAGMSLISAPVEATPPVYKPIEWSLSTKSDNDFIPVSRYSLSSNGADIPNTSLSFGLTCEQSPINISDDRRREFIFITCKVGISEEVIFSTTCNKYYINTNVAMVHIKGVMGGVMFMLKCDNTP